MFFLVIAKSTFIAPDGFLRAPMFPAPRNPAEKGPILARHSMPGIRTGSVAVPGSIIQDWFSPGTGCAIPENTVHA
jgi:hypothetical protein